MVLHLDNRNAFGETSRDNISKTINKRFSESLNIYAKMLLAEDSKISYMCPKTGKCIVIRYNNGVPQGNACSGSLFNVGQSESIKTVIEKFPKVIIISLHDDHHILGEQTEDTLMAFDSLQKLLKENCNNVLQAEKSVAFSFSQFSEEMKSAISDRNIKIVDHNEGIIIGGSPVGTKEYMKKEIDKILSSNLAIIKIVINLVVSEKGHGLTGPTAQAAIYILRQVGPAQFIHILRTCPPEVTIPAAKTLDDALFDLAMLVTSLQDKLPEEARELQDIVDRFHLPIRRGGAGIASCVDTAHAAYAASWALCGTHIGLLDNSLIYSHNVDNTDDIQIPEHLINLQNSLDIVNSKYDNMLKELDINISTIWEVSTPRVQKLIKAKINDALYQRIVDNLPLIGKNGQMNNKTNNVNSPAIIEIHLHHLGRNDPVANSFMNAHPIFPDNKLSNDEFSLAFATVIGVPFYRPQTSYCMKCGSSDYTDRYGGHALHCSKIHGTHAEMHASVKRTLLSAIHRLRPNTDTFLGKEPDLQRLGYKYHDNSNAFKCRGDIRIRNDDFLAHPSGELIIDVSTAHIAAHYVKGYAKAGDAANKREQDKITEYKRSFVNFEEANDYRPPVMMFTVETTGGLGKTAKEFCKLLCDPKSEDYSLKLSQLYQSLSITIVRSRVHQMISLNKNFTNQRPISQPNSWPIRQIAS